MAAADGAVSGNCFYIDWTTNGVDYYPFGFTGEVSYSDASPPAHRRGIRDVDHLGATWVVPEFKINFMPVAHTNSLAWILSSFGGNTNSYSFRTTNGFPTSPLRTFGLHVGIIDTVDDYRYELSVSNCKVNSLMLRGGIGKPLEASLSVLGGVVSLVESPATSLASTLPSEVHFESWDAYSVVYHDGATVAEVGVQEWELSVENNLRPTGRIDTVVTNMDEGAFNYERIPYYLWEGDFSARLRVEASTRIPETYRRNYTSLSQMAFYCALTNQSLEGSSNYNHTVVVYLTNMFNSSGESAWQSGGDLMAYNYEFVCPDNSQDAVQIAYQKAEAEA